MALVVKNKYGHQVKKPFPYFSVDRADIKLQSNYVATIRIHGSPVPVNIGGTGRLKKTAHNQTEYADNNKLISFNYEGHRLVLFIPKYLLYERISLAVSNFNEELKMFYRKNMAIGIEKQNPEITPFLY